jgi:3-oxoacyl-(acyl-carrier-protein) synthase
MNPAPRIFMTGLGVVSGAGLTLEAIWHSICSGKSAIGPIAQWDAANWPARRAAEVTGVSDSTLVPDRKLQKFLSRTDLFGLYAADQAVQQAGLTAHREGMELRAATLFNDRTGVFVGSGGGVFQNGYDFFPALTAAGGALPAFGREVESAVNPMWLLTRLPNKVLCCIGIRYGFKGTNACITNQCAGGALAIAEAAAAIRCGEADRAIAVGHDAPIEPETLLHYHALGLLSETDLRPFDWDRTGTILGGGAAAVVLESETEARARGVHVLGEFLGYGCTTEAAGILEVRRDGDGVKRAIELALADAGLVPGQIGMIVAHGNGTRASDASEAQAIRCIFDQEPPPVTAFKWAVGHTLAASAGLDLVLALTALEQGVVPGIGTLATLDPELEPLPVSPDALQPRSDIALVISRGFCGMNVALLVKSASAGAA